MKSKAVLEQIQREMIDQIPEFMLKVGECKDEVESMSMIAAYLSKLTMVSYTLSDRDTPYHIVELATAQAFDKAIDRVSEADLENAIRRRA
jgi:hypothetical protein